MIRTALKVMEMLYPNKCKTFTTILNATYLEDSTKPLEDTIGPAELNKLKSYLLEKGFIERQLKSNDFGLDEINPKYLLSDRGREIVLEYQQYQAIDKIVYWFYEQFQKDGPNGSYYSIQDVCNKLVIEYKRYYESTLMNNQIFTFLTQGGASKEGNLYHMENGAYEIRFPKGKIYVNRFLTQLENENSNPNIMGDNYKMHIGSINITNDNGIVSFGDNATNRITNYRDIIDSIITIDENDPSKFNNVELQRITGAIEKFESTLIQQFKLTGQGKGFISDQLEEVRAILAKENKGTFKRIGGKIFEGIVASLGKEGVFSIAGYLRDNSEFVAQYWQLLQAAFTGVF